MEYKYKRNQLFKKTLPVPIHIRGDVYSCRLAFVDYIAYDLIGKIPISCLEPSDREIVERFGLEKARKLDWSLLETRVWGLEDIKEVLLRFSPETEDLNEALYKALNHKLPPRSYSEGMKRRYPNREVKVNKDDDVELEAAKASFNAGNISLDLIIRYWEHFKDCDLTYALANDDLNTTKVTDQEVKNFMKEFRKTAYVIVNHTNIYELIRKIHTYETEDEKLEVLKSLSEEILAKTDEKYSSFELDNDQYKELFRFTSMKDYLSRVSGEDYFYNEIYQELEYEGLSQEFLLDAGIPVEYLKNRDVIYFIRTYGIKNIYEFDQECDHFFTKNDCAMLRRMYDYYMHYAGNNHDPKTTFYTKGRTVDSEGNYVYRPYTKDEFYEAMRRMIVGGPTDSDYVNSAPDYREMTGEFKRRNAPLFLDSNAPEDLKSLFYQKQLTPEIVKNNPDYVPFLMGKELSSCFKRLDVRVENNDSYMGYENFYSFLERKTDYQNVMEIVREYSDVMKIIFDSRIRSSYSYEAGFKEEDNIDQIVEKMNLLLVKLLIEKDFTYPQNIPSQLYEAHPEIFLSNDAPIELQKAFYSRQTTTKMLIEHPEYRQYLEGKNLQLLFKYMPIIIYENGNKTSYYRSRRADNLINIIQTEFKEDALQTLIEYGGYLEELHKIDGLRELELIEGYTKDDILNAMDKSLYEGIIKQGFKYDEKMSGHFKGNYPSLFLDDKVDQAIKDKFYNREFTIQDFNDNPDLIDIFGDTNIICGFDENISWLIPIIQGENNKRNNLIRLKVLTEYYKIQDYSLRAIFREYIESYKDNINLETLSSICEVLTRLSVSNSTEMYTFRKELAHQILSTDNPIESLNKVEAVFVKNSIPTVGKAYSCFEILHPDFKDFIMTGGTISPTLQESSNKKRKYIIFNDLLKASFGSNNRSINKYIDSVDKGYKLYSRVKEENIAFEDLSYEEQELLKQFRRTINTLYDRTLKGRTQNDGNIYTDDVIADIRLLETKLAEHEGEYNLADRVVRMFCGGTGLDTIEEAQKYVHHKVSTADKRNRQAASSPMELQKGDLIKGINDIKYLRNILQNGSVAKEFLGSSASSDATPLDTDVSMIMIDSGTTKEMIDSTAASGYGNIWLVLKGDDRFKITRDSEPDHNTEYDPTKLELFLTGVLGGGHYGIRTGFASSEVDYIVMEKYDTRVGLEIALNGFYIPVADKEGKIVFTPEDYDKLRSKMAGLKYYDEPSYVFSENLVSEEITAIANQIEASNRETSHKREIINKAIKAALDELGLSLKTQIDGDLTEKYVELIDTGSTGRGTNKPGDGDFDFMMRIDRAIMDNPEKLKALKDSIVKHLGVEGKTGLISTGDFRMKDVTLEDITVDIDITFTVKTDSVLYSTDMALQDRLETIKAQDKEKYNYVVANILEAKRVLKAANAYKPNRGETPQGGLGGVGIENWILQHGGSFYDAAKSFVAAAEGKSFEDFLHTYEVWDFGDNHLAEKRGQPPHDEFVANNMSREGFIKMTNALKEYLKQVEKNRFQTTEFKI